jgi:uncharacterized membrane protein YphA (DoxX/SURF4 family)
MRALGHNGAPTRPEPSKRASDGRRQLRGIVLALPVPTAKGADLSLGLHAHHVPGRLVTGAYILHAGLGKWRGSEEQAAGVHGMASGAYPFLRDIPPAKFMRMLAAGEIATGLLLLAPIPNRLAGLALTIFSGALIAMYLRTPSLHQPGSFWPTQAGTAVSKDIWMVGIGLGLLVDHRAPVKEA